MTHDQFAALVQRLEPEARRNPAAYEFKVHLLALCGYAYLWLVVALRVVGTGLFLLVLVLAKAAYIAVKLLFIVVPLLWVTVKSM